MTQPSSFRYEPVEKLEHVPLFVKSGVGLVFIENVRRSTASSARLFTSIQTLARDSRVLSSVVADRVRLLNGKWYFEVTPKSGSVSSGIHFGLTQNTAPTGFLGQNANGYSYYGYDGQKYNNNAGVAYGATVADNDVVGIAFDATAGSVTFYKNNVSQGVAFSSLAAGTWFLGVSCYNIATASVNFGQQPFTYTPPTGFLPLNTFNIAAGTVTTSGTFTGNLSTDGPMVYLNGTPTAMTINGNAVTFGTHADKLANGFKVRSSSVLYNLIGSNTYVATTVGAVFKYEDAQGNP